MKFTLKQMAAAGMPPDQVEMIRKAKADWKRKISRARVKARAATGDERIAAISHLTSLLNSEERPHELLKLIDRDPPETFWPVFLTEWSSCDAGWMYQERLAQILRRVGPCPAAVYSCRAEDGGDFYAGLPERMTVYRGGDRTRIEGGVSWTTNRKVALSFAWGHRGIRAQSPVIATATVNKADIFAAITDRGEEEIICLPHQVETVEAIDREFSEMFVE
jgi:hypothetical protein